jgi:uncharacterized membrane protein
MPDAPPGSRWLPDARTLFDVRAPYLVPLLALVLTRIYMWIVIQQGSEDAYITFRYARQLATGLGLVYNPGERVIGFSSPVWTVWNALGSLLTGQPLAWSRATAMVADVITLVTTVSLLVRHSSRTAAWCFASFFAAWPYFAAVSMSAMETPLVNALIPLTACLLAARSAAGGVTLGALALTRPEGLLSAAVLALVARGRERIIALVILACGLGALAAYYGTVVPQSVIAKASMYGTPGPWANRTWWEWLVPFQVGGERSPGDTILLIRLSLVLAPAALLGAAALWRDRRSPLAVAAAAALVVWLGYAALGVAYFWWYLAVPLAGIVLLASIGMPRLVRGRALYAMIAVLIVGNWWSASTFYSRRWQEEAGSFGGAADFLVRHSRPGEKVMLEPIGMVGYESGLTVIDEVGLVSPSVAARRLGGPGWYADVAARERPDWLVVRYGVLRSGVAFAGAGAPFRDTAERDSLLARYQAVGQASPDLNDQTLMILRRIR